MTKTTAETSEPTPRKLADFSAKDIGTIALCFDNLQRWPACDGEPQPVALKTLAATYCFPPNAIMGLDELLARLDRLVDFGLAARISEGPTVFRFHEPTFAQLLLLAATFRLSAEQLIVSDLILEGGYAVQPSPGNAEGAGAFLKSFRACVAKLEAVSPESPWLAWLKAGGHNDPATADSIELASCLFTNSNR